MSNKQKMEDLTLAELELKLLAVFERLCLILENSHSNQPVNNIEDGETSFATAVHMSKAKNDVGAAKFMRRAALSGHIKAQFYLGMMFGKGAGLPQSEYHAYTWLTLAESQGSIEAVEAIAKLQSHLCSKQIKDARKQAADLYELIQNRLISCNIID